MLVPSLPPPIDTDLSPIKPAPTTCHKISNESEEGQLSGEWSSISSPVKGRESEMMEERGRGYKIEGA